MWSTIILQGLPQWRLSASLMCKDRGHITIEGKVEFKPGEYKYNIIGLGFYDTNVLL